MGGFLIRVVIRPATGSDAKRVAEVYLSARRAAVPAIPPSVHTDQATIDWVRRCVTEAGWVWVAEVDGQIQGLLMLADCFVDQLYVAPAYTGRGIGLSLLRHAKNRCPAGLQLWTFRANVRARRFYERHGFRAVEETDGSGNEEHAPDVRYVWP